jgi:hypothetical protein
MGCKVRPLARYRPLKLKKFGLPLPLANAVRQDQHRAMSTIRSWLLRICRINTGPAITLLTEHAASAVAAFRKATTHQDRIRAQNEAVQHMLALGGLGLSVDDVVARVIEQATLNLRTVDEDGFVMFPERHELDRLLRRMLSSAIE